MLVDLFVRPSVCVPAKAKLKEKSIARSDANEQCVLFLGWDVSHSLFSDMTCSMQANDYKPMTCGYHKSMTCGEDGGFSSPTGHTPVFSGTSPSSVSIDPSAMIMSFGVDWRPSWLTALRFRSRKEMYSGSREFSGPLKLYQTVLLGPLLSLTTQWANSGVTGIVSWSCSHHSTWWECSNNGSGRFVATCLHIRTLLK